MEDPLVKPYRKPPVSRKGQKGPTGPREAKKLHVKKRLLGKWKVHPADPLVRIAKFVEGTNDDLAAKIWMRLLDSCELEEKTKKGYMPPPAGNESAAEAEAMRALEEAEKDDQATPQSNSDGVADRAPEIQAEASSTTDL